LKDLQLKANNNEMSIFSSRPNSPRLLTPLTNNRLLDSAASNPATTTIPTPDAVNPTNDAMIYNANKPPLSESDIALESAVKEKNRLKKEIKTWISEFKTKHGREPSIKDKEEIISLFEAHAKVTENSIVFIFLI